MVRALAGPILHHPVQILDPVSCLCPTRTVAHSDYVGTIDRICWDSFVDNESPITSYSYQVYNQVGDKPGTAQDVAITPAIKVSLPTMEVVVDNLELKVPSLFQATALPLVQEGRQIHMHMYRIFTCTSATSFREVNTTVCFLSTITTSCRWKAGPLSGYTGVVRGVNYISWGLVHCRWAALTLRACVL